MDTYHPLALDDDAPEYEEHDGNRVPWYWPRRYIVARVLAFLVLQLAFYGFAIACHVRPYNLTRVSPVPLANYFVELKGGFIIAFTTWHTLSIAFISDIILTIFSLEWAVQAEKKCVLEPGQTDRVSTPASGVFDRIKYGFKKGQGASGMFRYALAASLVLMLLAATGPGCFTLSTLAVAKQPFPLREGASTADSYLAMSLGPAPLSDLQATLLKRIGDVVQLEQVEGFTWGYEMPPNVFATWPYDSDGQLIHQQAPVTYWNRAITFKVNCRWETPATTDLLLQGNIPKPITSGVVPVSFNNATRTDSGHSGLLLVGCTAGSSSQDGCSLNMTGVQGAKPDDNDIWHGTAALLACDPSGNDFIFSRQTTYQPLTIECAQLTLADGRIDVKAQICNNFPGGDNVPSHPGNMFASALLFALQPPSLTSGNSTPGDIGIGLLAGELLFDDYTSTFGSNMTRQVAQIQLFDVETKFSKYLTSAGKVFMAGYEPVLDNPASQSLFNLTGLQFGMIVAEVDQVTLVGNKAMVITSMILLVISLRLLQLSLRSLFWKQSRVRVLEPFGISSVGKMDNLLKRMERLRNADEDP